MPPLFLKEKKNIMHLIYESTKPLQISFFQAANARCPTTVPVAPPSAVPQ